MSDNISRADAICEVLVNDGIDNIVDRIKALPSANYETKCVARIEVDTEEIVRRIKEEYDITDRWIPCSERLPEEGRYFVTTTLSVFSPQILNYDADGGEWFYDGCKSMDLDIPCVTAWMPLLEPYREDGEE